MAPYADTYPMHSGARWVLTICGILFCITIVLSPIGLILIIGVRRARIEIGDGEIREHSTFRVKKRLSAENAERIGLYIAPLPGGIAGWLARKKVGGAAGVNLCWKDRNGKTRWMLVAQYEEMDEIIDRAKEMTRLPLEELSMGLMGVKWRED